MAYGYANVGATELADLALDKPLIGANVTPRIPERERWNQTGTYAAADDTAAGYPIHRLHDADPEYVTKPDTAATTQYINLRFTNPVDVDHIAIGPGHNLGTLALTGLAFEVDRNQDGVFTAVDSCDLVAAFPMSSDNRILQLDLDPGGGVGTPQRFTDVEYCRLKMTKGTNFTPEITELIIGSRYQFPRWPNKPFNQNNIGDLTETSDPSKGGGIDKTTFAEGQFILDGEWTLKSGETTRLRSTWKQMRGSLIWCWEPSSAPNSFHMLVRDGDRLQLPFVGHKTHSFEITGIEQGPESKYLERDSE